MTAPRSGPPRTPLPTAATLRLDSSGHIIWANPAVQSLLERTAPDLRGRGLLTLVSENALYLGRLLSEPRWLDLGHDAIWSSATFSRADGSPLECMIRVRRAMPDARTPEGGFELRLEPHRTPVPAGSDGAARYRTPATGGGNGTRACQGRA